MKKIFLVLFSIIIFGCQDQIVELDIPNHTPFLVVNGILDTDSIISLHISNSVGSFEEGQINSISDANVLLYENDALIGEMEINSDVDSLAVLDQFGWGWNWGTLEPIYYYTFNILPQVGSTYSISANHINYDPVFAHTTIPNEIELSELEIIDNSDESDIYNARLNLSFFDNPSERNYYRVRLFRHTNNEEETEYSHKRHALLLYSNDPSLSQGIPWDGYTFSGRRALFSDDLFDGIQKDISFDFEYKLEGVDNGDSLFLQLTSFSEEAYNYFNSMENNSGSFFGPFGTEPVPVFSNVENGAGIFASGNSIYFQILP